MVALIVIVVFAIIFIFSVKWWISTAATGVSNIKKSGDMNANLVTKRYYVVDKYAVSSIEKDVRVAAVYFKHLKRYPDYYEIPLSFSKGESKDDRGRTYTYFDITTIPAFHNKLSDYTVSPPVSHLYTSLDHPDSWEWSK